MATKSVKVVPADPTKLIQNPADKYTDKYTGHSNSKTIKINSAKVTPQGTQPALRIRTTGGLGGLGGGGGIFRDFNR